MGQKADPVGLRLGIHRQWDSLWFGGKKQYACFVHEDMRIRAFLTKQLRHVGVSHITVARTEHVPHISVFVARPGMVIGKKGSGIDQLVGKLKEALKIECTFNVVELRKPDLYAQVVADDIAQQLERRVHYKRAMRKAIQGVMKVGAKGIRVNCAGRLGGIEIARTEWYLEGRLPLQTFRSDVDFARGIAKTSSGICGVKVWIYRGDVLEKGEELLEKRSGDLSHNWSK